MRRKYKKGLGGMVVKRRRPLRIQRIRRQQR